MKNIYVTFQIKPSRYFQGLGFQTKHYAIQCANEQDAREAASNIYGLDGISYLTINKCGRLKHKDTKIIQYGSNYTAEID